RLRLPRGHIDDRHEGADGEGENDGEHLFLHDDRSIQTLRCPWSLISRAVRIQLFEDVEAVSRFVKICRCVLKDPLVKCGVRQQDFSFPSYCSGGLRMKRIVSVVAALAVLALASTASAQVQTGSILVRAVDEQGALMPGVTITLTSPVLVA